MFEDPWFYAFWIGCGFAHGIWRDLKASRAMVLEQGAVIAGIMRKLRVKDDTKPKPPGAAQ